MRVVPPLGCLLYICQGFLKGRPFFLSKLCDPCAVSTGATGGQLLNAGRGVIA